MCLLEVGGVTEDEYPPLVQQHIGMIRNLREALAYYVKCADMDTLPVRCDMTILAKAALLDAREPLIP
jgi:hypothetical protein